MSEKRNAPDSSKNNSKKARQSISLETKMEVIRRMEDGQTRPNVCRCLSLPPSTVTTIMTNSVKIKHSVQQSTGVSVKHVSYSRGMIFEKMEKLLALWVDDANKKNIPLTQAAITEKAKSIFCHLKQTHGGEQIFSGSKGWFMRFKTRSNCHSVKFCGEAASADLVAAAEFPKEFQRYVEQGNYSPDQIFNVDETAVFWKRLPARTYICREECSAPGFKAAKDRVTVLLGANVSGTLKLKPMLVYRSQTPRALKGLNKNMLPVYWKYNKKAWVTQNVFTDWYTNYFSPTVLRFCEDKKLQPKVLLLLDNAPGHPQNLNEIRTPLDVKVVYMLPNTTSLLQPMDQGVIATFKAYYLRNTLMEMIRVLDSSDKTIKDYWLGYDILKGIKNIKSAWDEVSTKCLNGVWRKLLPAFVDNFVFEEDLTENISKLARHVGLDDVTAKDVTELLECHDQPLSNEDLEELAKELDCVRSEEIDKESEEETLRVMKTADLQRIISSMESLTDELCDLDYDWERSTKVKRAIISSIGPYSEILNERKQRSKQLKLDNFFLKNVTDPKL